MSGALAAFGAVVARDLRLVWRRRGDAVQPLLFAVLVCTLFPLALGPEPALLTRVAPAVIWIAVVLSGLLSLDTLFRGDLEDGSLEQLLPRVAERPGRIEMRLYHQAVHADVKRFLRDAGNKLARA